MKATTYAATIALIMAAPFSCENASFARASGLSCEQLKALPWTKHSEIMKIAHLETGTRVDGDLESSKDPLPLIAKAVKPLTLGSDLRDTIRKSISELSKLIVVIKIPKTKLYNIYTIEGSDGEIIDIWAKKSGATLTLAKNDLFLALKNSDSIGVERYYGIYETTPIIVEVGYIMVNYSDEDIANLPADFLTMASVFIAGQDNPKECKVRWRNEDDPELARRFKGKSL